MNAKKFSTWMIIGAIVLMVLGIIAIAWPGHTANALVILFGIIAIVDGIIKTYTGAKAPSGASGRVASIVVGVLGIVAGLLTVIMPIIGIAVFAWAVGVWLIIRGVLDLVMAFGRNLITGAAKVVLVITGILWILVAFMVLSAPALAATVFIIFAGVVAVAIGVFTLFGGILLRGADATWGQHQRQG